MAAANEKVKNSFKETPKESKSEAKQKSKSSAEGKSSFKLPSFGFGFLKSEKFIKVTGLLLIVVSFFLLLAFVSYFITWFSWNTDDIFSDISLKRIIFDTSLEVQNWAGRLGAATAQKFVKDWFGISSLVFVLVIFVVGFKMFLGVSLLPLKKMFKYGFFGLIWTSITLGFFLDGPKSGVLGGIFGYETSGWLNGLIGRPGTLILIIASLSLFVISTFDLYNLLTIKEKEKPEGDDFGKNKPTDLAKGGEGLTYEELERLDGLGEEDELDDEEIIDDDPEDLALEMELVTKPSEQPVEELIDDEDEFDVSIASGDLVADRKPTVEPLDEPVTDSDEEILHHGIDTEFDPTEDLKDFKFPSLDLLQDHGASNEISINKEELEENKNKIVKTLQDYSIKIEKIKATIGPTITLYEIVPAPGVRISKIKNLEDDIALSLSALGIRIIAPIPGKGTIGIEVPNKNPEMVPMRTILSSEKFQNFKGDLPVGIGKTISNETFVFDLAKMPHMLMAGATGQGKSVGINAVITSLLFKKHPAQLKFVMVDPKKVELSLFSKIERHYLAKLPGRGEAIITDTRDVVTTLNSLCLEMDTRYDLLKDAQVRNIKEYNEKFVKRRLNPNLGHRYLPYIVLVVDEFADLIMTAGKEVEGPIARLAQLARAIGIHLIIATQRPSVNIITGVIKANFPARIAFRVTSKVDSRTILDTGGADQLIGRGDMLFSTGSSLIRLQCAFVDTPEVEEITDYIGNQRGYASALELPEVESDEEAKSDIDLNDRDSMFDDAARVVVQNQHGSTSLIQRKLKLGYNRAGRIMDQLEAAGVVGPFEGSKAREVLITDMIYLEQFLSNLGGK